MIHVAAMSSTEVARREPVLAEAVNVAGTRRLASWAASNDRRLLYTSTDFVFDGSKSWNTEDDPARPILEYGRTKRDAEPAVLVTPRGLVVRLSLLYGPSRSGREGYFDRAMATMRAGTPQSFFIDEFRTPLDYITASSILDPAGRKSESTGLIHVGGPERLSRFDTLMQRAPPSVGVDSTLGCRCTPTAAKPTCHPPNLDPPTSRSTRHGSHASSPISSFPGLKMLSAPRDLLTIDHAAGSALNESIHHH